MQRLVNRGHCQDPRQPSADTIPTLLVFPGHQALAFMGWFLGVGGWLLQNNIVGSWSPSPRDPVCRGEPWPLPACQGNGGTLDLEVLVLLSSHLWKLLSPPPSQVPSTVLGAEHSAGIAAVYSRLCSLEGQEKNLPEG